MRKKRKEELSIVEGRQLKELINEARGKMQHEEDKVEENKRKE